MQEVISNDSAVILKKWFDNNSVIMGSNFKGIGDTDTCKHWDKKKKYLYVPRPEVVRHYSTCMGGVDKFDFLISIYLTFICSIKWTQYLFAHILDMAIINSWLDYVCEAKCLGLPTKKTLDLMHFRQHVA
ncbi:hypothetical protein PR048_009002 [Dryococelus australis]|uniref:PiggyBac transposable element-derived protein domain-containing protein n=1 Tax=Dryococelus australis TaxID=614101 RepID=A0ABQ9HYP4_9NEOP|nr:hypothetical protein PR048_009002 [Dryococelus australis]